MVRQSASTGLDAPPPPPSMLEDSKRVAMIVKLVEAGHADKVVLSSDFFREEQLKKEGGPGYSKVVTMFAPLLRDAGLDEATVRGCLRDNPLRWQAFQPQSARGVRLGLSFTAPCATSAPGHRSGKM